MNIVYVKIGQHQFNDSAVKKGLIALRNRFIPLALYQDENNYLAEAIEYQGHYFYRIEGVTVEAEKYEYEHIFGLDNLIDLYNQWNREKILNELGI